VSRSTAKFISYDLRPAKQSERMILVDILKIGGDCGLPMGSYRYVGMGANRFYDYLLLHRYIGIKNMVSLEHDPEMYKRAVFNVPYKFIEVLEKSATEFLANDMSDAPTISWLDYDGGIGPEIGQDIASLCLKMKVGDFFFTTVYGWPPRVIERQNSDSRLNWLKDNMGDIAGQVEMEDVENSTFRNAVHKMLIAAFQNAFAVRREGGFLPLLQVVYADSKPMVTVGGAFLTQGQVIGYRKKMETVLPFLSTDEAKLYEIRTLNLTERERVLFDHAVTAKLRRSAEWNCLKRLGFKEKELNAYRDLVRYLPRYVEAIV
jgi:hypothetical protein